MTLQEIVFALAALLVGARLPHPPAVGRRGGRGHDAPGDVLPRARPEAVEGRLRAALAAARRRPLRREPEPPLQAPAVPGDPEAAAGGHPGPVPGLARGDRHRPRGARRALRGGQLGVADARGLGHRLAGAPRRAGDHAVHLLPAGGRHRPRADLGRDHLRPRAHRDVPAGRGRRLRAALVGGHASTATCATRRSSSSRATPSSSPTWSCTAGSSTARSPRAGGSSRRTGGRAYLPAYDWALKSSHAFNVLDARGRDLGEPSGRA